MKKTRLDRNPRSMSMKTTIALMVIIFMVAVGGTLIAYTIYTNVYVAGFDIEFEVSEAGNVGINADSNLNFGKLPFNSSASAIKEMNFFNDYGFPVLVQIDVESAVKKYVIVTENYFVLQPGEHKSVDWIARNYDLPTGNYTGRAMVVYKRA